MILSTTLVVCGNVIVGVLMLLIILFVVNVKKVYESYIYARYY